MTDVELDEIEEIANLTSRSVLLLIYEVRRLKIERDVLRNERTDLQARLDQYYARETGQIKWT